MLQLRLRDGYTKHGRPAALATIVMHPGCESETLRGQGSAAYACVS